jgi:hypothetical protein
MIILKGITNEILAMEIRQGLHHLGEIIADDLLNNKYYRCFGNLEVWI